MSEAEQREAQRDRMAAHTRHTAHERNLAGMREDEGDRARLLELTVDSDLESPDEALKNLRAKDFPLANFDQLADTFEFKGFQEILALLNEARYPHRESVLQGAVREWAFDKPGEALEARDPDEVIAEEAYLLGTYSRATRGEDGFQQETAAKQTRESITVDEGGAGGRGGLRSRIPGL